MAITQTKRASARSAMPHPELDHANRIRVDVEQACQAMFGHPLVPNNFRPILVEAMISRVLTDWEWVAANWAGWDFQRQSDGLRIEVKQSAATQTWSAARLYSDPTKIQRVFSIAASKGHWEDGAGWVEGAGGKANVYIFAWQIDGEAADHRDRTQWRFYVVPTSALPLHRKTISLASVQKTRPAGRQRSARISRR